MREFLAIPLPEPVRRKTGDLARALDLPADRFRLTTEDGLHVTVRFLGEVDPARAAGLDEAWRAAAGGTGSLTLRVAGVSAAPSRARPRVVWLNVHDESGDPRLAPLARRLEQAAREHGFAPETREFTGHVTIARARHGVRPRPLDLAQDVDLGTFVADRLVLFRSRLGPGGSTYEELASYPLDSGARR